MGKTAVIIGASGLTGEQLLQQLLQHNAYAKVVALVRRPMDIQHPKLTQSVLDFDHPDPSLVVGDDFYCALGTTLAQAGSKEAQYKIDCTYPSELGKIAKANGMKRYLLVSSIGADAHSANFYLNTKGTLERNIEALGFDCFVAARPSFLLGNRKVFRLGERIGIVLANILAPLMVGGLRKYRGIHVSKVAAALIRKANDGAQGHFVLHYEEFV